MNRQMRRMMGHGKLPEGAREQRHDITISYGTSGHDNQVMLAFNRPIDNLRLQPEQVRDMIDKLQKCLEHIGPAKPGAASPAAIADAGAKLDAQPVPPLGEEPAHG